MKSPLKSLKRLLRRLRDSFFAREYWSLIAGENGKVYEYTYFDEAEARAHALRLGLGHYFWTWWWEDESRWVSQTVDIYPKPPGGDW